ncbi:MAG: hypothetical protein ACRDTG_29170 [Pseudonocardiaceae bacterium]
MARGGAPIQVEGLRELRQAIRRHGDKDLSTQLGRVHKEIGRLVISRLQPRPVPSAVGRGGGAAVRASAASREVLLRVGGDHRQTRAQQWGKHQVPPFQDAPARPFVVGTALAQQEQIERMLLDGIERSLKPPFQ